MNADPSTPHWISGDGDEYNCGDGEYNRCDDDGGGDDGGKRRPLHKEHLGSICDGDDHEDNRGNGGDYGGGGDGDERRPLHPSSSRTGTPPRSADEATLRLFPGVSNPTNGSHQLAIVIIIRSSYLHYHWFGKKCLSFSCRNKLNKNQVHNTTLVPTPRLKASIPSTV